MLKVPEEAAFALDHNDRIIFWNPACEELLGFKAKDVLGKRCYEVLRGEDVHRNLYCYPNCPVMHQLRRPKPERVHDFPLTVSTGPGERKVVSLITLLAPSAYAEPPKIVHIVRDDPSKNDQRAESGTHAPLLRLLTSREVEVLRCMAGGMSTSAIAVTLAISGATVRNHVQSILQKLNVHTRSAAVGIAYRGGVVSGETKPSDK